ncbi:glycosyltransferase [Salinisphaera orenii]|uniref:glycosyltransferase n=1 Tax=Salinisphaera orenii TaxID=856731 RepID=UPI000F4B3371
MPTPPGIWQIFGCDSRALQDAGYEVIAAAPYDDNAKRLEAAGLRFVSLPMDNAGTNPLRDALLTARLVRLLIRERIDVYLGYTVKPNVYGGIACRLTRVPSVHNVAGLGTVFMCDNLLTRVVRGLYRLGMKRAAMVFFQNADDYALFEKAGLVDAERATCLPGSGVDTARFAPQEREQGAITDRGPFRFVLSARLLWDKGIGEFIEATRRLKGDGADIECELLGFLGAENRTAIPRAQIRAWEREGLVRYRGAVEDVRHTIAQADCIVLPSYYREGTPRSLLEAASMGKPIITTDAIGCRNTVEHGVTGYLCKPRDAADLADRMRDVMALTEDQRMAMGEQGRKKMQAEFEESIVIDRYLMVIRQIVSADSGPAARRA